MCLSKGITNICFLKLFSSHLGKKMKQVTELYVKITFKPVDQGLFSKIRYQFGIRKWWLFSLVNQLTKCQLRMEAEVIHYRHWEVTDS